MAELRVPPPAIVDRQLKNYLQCGPGPCNVWPSIYEANQNTVFSPLCDELFNTFDDVRAGIQYLFQTRSKLVLAMSGSGHSGMETVISNVLAPGETLLVATRGSWDERAADLARRQGIKVEVRRIPVTETFSLPELDEMLKEVKPHALFITHGDSSNGTIQRLEGLGKLCHKYGALLIVDTVVSIAAAPFLMDEWEVDAVYTSTQKALSGPAGISPVAFSARAESKIINRTHQVPYYFDIKLLAEQWNCYGNTRKYHHTMSTPLLCALRFCLKKVSDETLPKSWARHAASTTHFHKRLQEYGFELLIPKPENRLPSVTTIKLPRGYDYMQFCKYMKEKHNIVIMPGMGATVGKALRVGIMGVNASTEVADRVASAMADTLRNLKKSSL